MFVFYWIYWKWLLIFMCHQKPSNMHLVCISLIHTNKGISLQPDWSEIYKKKHIELSFVWFILKVFQRHKRNHNFYSTACQHISYKSMFIMFWFVLVIEIRKKNPLRKLLSDTLIRACNNWLIMRGGFVRCNYFWTIYSVI